MRDRGLENPLISTLNNAKVGLGSYFQASSAPQNTAAAAAVRWRQARRSRDHEKRDREGRGGAPGPTHLPFQWRCVAEGGGGGGPGGCTVKLSELRCEESSEESVFFWLSERAALGASDSAKLFQWYYGTSFLTPSGQQSSSPSSS